MATSRLSFILVVFIAMQIYLSNALTLRQLPSTSTTSSSTSLANSGADAAATTVGGGGTINDIGVTTVRRGTNLVASQLIEALRGVTALIDTLQHFTLNTGQYLERLRISTQSLGDGLLQIGTNVATTAVDEFSNRLIDRRTGSTSSASSSRTSNNNGNSGDGSGSSNLLTFLATRQLSSDESGSTDSHISDGRRQFASAEKNSADGQIGDRTRQLTSVANRSTDGYVDSQTYREPHWNISLDDFWSTVNSWANNMTPGSDGVVATDANKNIGKAHRLLGQSLSQGAKSAEQVTKLVSDSIQSWTNNLPSSSSSDGSTTATSTTSSRNRVMSNLANTISDTLSQGAKSVEQLTKRASDSIENGINKQRSNLARIVPTISTVHNKS